MRTRLARGARTAPPVDPERRLNRLCRRDGFDDAEWRVWWDALAVPPETCRHRKAWEWVQCVYGLERLGVLGPVAKVLGVGAGHERPLYHLANRSAITVATDLYDHAGAWTDSGAEEGNPVFLSDPGAFAPFGYDRTRLHPLVCDGRTLPFADEAFDVVYSLSSIEHFGGTDHAGATAAVREMARVTRVGGIVCIATEWILSGASHHEFFRPHELQRLIDRAGLVAVEPIDTTPPEAELLAHPIADLHGEYDGTHIVLTNGTTTWTSVVVFLRKLSTLDLLRARYPRRSRRPPG